MMTKILFAIFVILFTSTAAADSRVKGHMTPLKSEMLSSPVKLNCGAVVREWRGGDDVSFKERIDKINSLCSFAQQNFFEFVKTECEIQKSGMTIRLCRDAEINEQQPFSYSISMIPLDSNYRNLNDKEFRFINRGGNQGKISGYTSFKNEYVFNISDVNDKEFDVSFVHEMFHAMSRSYGLQAQYKVLGEYYRVRRDERLARAFTLKYMGRI